MKVAELNLNKEVGRFIRLVHDPSYLICNSNDDLVCEIPTNLLVKFFNSVFLRSNIPPTTPLSSSLSKNKAISWPPKYCTNYQLGFDHLPTTTNEDKLVCRLNIKKHDDDDTGTIMYCTFEVLTFRGCKGNKRRRTINELVLPYQLIMDNNSVYVNDFRWIGINSILPGVGSDKFRAIQLQTSVIDSLLVSEILTRLPVKSLFRFKSVSKQWCSTIQHDKHFIHSHFTLSKTRSPTRLLIVVPGPIPSETSSYAELSYDIDPCPHQEEYDDDTPYWPEDNFYCCEESWPDKEYHVTADLLFEDKSRTKVVVDTVREIDYEFYNKITKSVNGLICLIDSRYNFAVRIYNLSTGEMSPWFESSLLGERKIVNGMSNYRMPYSYFEPHYEFGFDPATSEYKVLCVWDLTSSAACADIMLTICEVLTFRGCQGNNNTSWRRINELPPCDLSGDSVYVNGVIYWTTFGLRLGKFGNNCRPICLVAFDVGSEKFRAITLPDFILDQCLDNCPAASAIHYYYSNNYQHVQLLEVDGCLAMLIRIKDCVFNMYIYEDDYKEASTDSSSSHSSRNNGRWSQMSSSITLPWNLDADHWVYFHTFVGSDDKIILTHSDGGNFGKEKKKCVFFYCYNWKTGTWTEFDVDGSIPSSIPQILSESHFTTFSENLLPLNNHNALSPSS